MRKTCLAFLCLCLSLSLAAPARADLVMVDNLQSADTNVTVDGRACPGTLGGLWDTEGENTGNMKVQGEGTNKLLVAQGRSNGSDRGAGWTQITNPIGVTETGTLFFRVKIMPEAKPVQTYYGMHCQYNADFLTDPALPSEINAGFVFYRPVATSGPIEVRTTDDVTILKSDIAQNQWYNVWIVADHNSDTFDLYISPTAGAGGAVELPGAGDLVATGVPFSGTPDALEGFMLCTRNGGEPYAMPQIAETRVDDFYWDGDSGLSHKTAHTPDPANDAHDVLVSTKLSWQAPDDPNIDFLHFTPQYAVYMDPNQQRVQTGVGCQYTRSLDPSLIFDPTPVGDLPYDTQFYWRVDTQVKFHDKAPQIFTGSVWTFETEKENTDPVVDAGDSLVTWLAAAQAGIDLDTRTNKATLIDNEDDADLLWDDPASGYPGLPSYVTITEPNMLNPVVTITQTGAYDLRVTADDHVNDPAVDMMRIDVYPDACEAAKHNPAGYTPNKYDVNNDCLVNLVDFAEFATQWLVDTSATTNAEHVVGGLDAQDLVIWLDASDAATLTIVGGKVTRWNDKTPGAGNYLTAGVSGRDPNYIPAALNGKGIVDFGPCFPDNTGIWMQWRDPDGDNYSPSNIRTVFWVLKGANHLLGDNTTYHFHRGGDIISATAEIWSGNTSDYITSGKTYLNRAQVNGRVTQLPPAYSLVSVVTTGNVEASRLCADRSLRTGGQQIAEIIAFDRPLSDAERQQVELELQAKWGTP